MKFIVFLIAIFLGLTGPALARDWDERLQQISQLAYQAQLAEAATLAEAYLKENPNDPNAYFMRAMVYDWERNLGDGDPDSLKEKSYQLYKKGNQIAFFKWEKQPKNPDTLIDFGNSYIMLGRILSDQGKWFRAIMTAKKGPKHLEKALSLEPDRRDGLMTLGIFNYVADNTPPAAGPFKKLFGISGSETEGLKQLQGALKGDHPYKNDALVALYYVHFNFDKNYPKALSFVNQLAQKFPQNPQWPMARAEIIEKQDKARGITAYLEVVEWCQQKPHPPCAKKFIYDSYFRAGRLAKELNQREKAKTYLKHAIASGLSARPGQHEEARRWLEEL
jgi:hypothetical protein